MTPAKLPRTSRRLPERQLPRTDRMKLLAALAVALLYTRGPQPITEALWKEALEIADPVAAIAARIDPVIAQPARVTPR